MKCRWCEKEAIVRLRSYNLKLCGECFVNFFRRRISRTIEEFKMFTPQERVLVAVSGGKDSLVLWDVLDELGYLTEGVYINLGIKHHSDVSEEKVKKFAKDKELPLGVVCIREELGGGIKEVAEALKRIPCRICGMVKRYIINRQAQSFDCVATGHNLDDESAALLGNVLNWQEGFLMRQAPVLERNSTFQRKVKPLCLVSEEEIRLYAQLRRIDFVDEKCPLSKEATSLFYKKIMNEIEDKMPATKIRFYKEFVRKGYFKFKRGEEKSKLSPCSKCGYLTINEVCTFCQMKERLEKTLFQKICN